MAHTALLIERLLQFSLQHSLIGELDAYVARNTLLDLFGLSEPWADGVPEEHLDVPTVLLDALLDVEQRLPPELKCATIGGLACTRTAKCVRERLASGCGNCKE